jgi:hypothetical protein
MSFKAGEGVPGGNGEKAAGEPELESPEEMIAFARDYFASDFSNPARTGCPAPDAIQEIVRAGKPPGVELRAHLFGCSECLAEFDRTMRARANVPPVAAPWWGKLLGARSLRPDPLLAGALCLLLFVSAGVYLRRYYRWTNAPDIADFQPDKVNLSPGETPKDDPTASPTPHASTDQVTPMERAEKIPHPSATARGRALSLSRARAKRQDTGERVAINTVAVDLEEYTVLRGGALGKAITLSRSLTRLKLTLPEGSAAGLYSLSILDASGKVLVTAKTRSADGSALDAVLDARKLAPQKYRLRLLRDGEAPQYFPIVIVEGSESTP